MRSEGGVVGHFWRGVCDVHLQIRTPHRIRNDARHLAGRVMRHFSNAHFHRAGK